MVLLVTGCAGFIGTNFIYYYLDKYPDKGIIGIDSLTYAGKYSNFDRLTPDQKRRFVFYHADIRDRATIPALFHLGVDKIINFAAETHVDTSIRNPELFFQSNAFGTFNLIECARKVWEPGNDNRFIQISTDEVYGENISIPATERNPLSPGNPYSASKAAGDLFIRSYYNTYGFPGIITRSSNNYGPYQYPEKLIPLTIKKALAHEPVPVYGKGQQIREWLYVKDHCTAIDRVLEKGKAGEIYNISTGDERKNIDVVKKVLSLLMELTGDEQITTGLIRFVEDRPGHDRRYSIDSTKIRLQLQWRPETKFDDGLTGTVKWYWSNHEK
jgi:dTDP-glucose 4,6-dehydratase